MICFHELEEGRRGNKNIAMGCVDKVLALGAHPFNRVDLLLRNSGGSAVELRQMIGTISNMQAGKTSACNIVSRQ